MKLAKWGLTQGSSLRKDVSIGKVFKCKTNQPNQTKTSTAKPPSRGLNDSYWREEELCRQSPHLGEATRCFAVSLNLGVSYCGYFNWGKHCFFPKCGLGLKPDCLFNRIQSRYKVGVGMGSGWSLCCLCLIIFLMSLWTIVWCHDFRAMVFQIHYSFQSWKTCENIGCLLFFFLGESFWCAGPTVHQGAGL